MTNHIHGNLLAVEHDAIKEILTKPGVKQKVEDDAVTFIFPEPLSAKKTALLKNAFDESNLAIISFVANGKPDYSVTIREAALPMLQETLWPYPSAIERRQFVAATSIFARHLLEVSSHLKIGTEGLFKRNQEGLFAPVPADGMLADHLCIQLQIDEGVDHKSIERRLDHLCKDASASMMEHSGGVVVPSFSYFREGNNIYVDISPLLKNTEAGIELIRDLSRIESRRGFGRTLAVGLGSMAATIGATMIYDANAPEKKDAVSKRSTLSRRTEGGAGALLTAGGLPAALHGIGEMARDLNNAFVHLSATARERLRKFTDNACAQTGVEPPQLTKDSMAR